MNMAKDKSIIFIQRFFSTKVESDSNRSILEGTSQHMQEMLWLRLSGLVFLSILVFAKDTWHKPGCHKVGNTRKIMIPDCVEFMITTNACRGFCESYAVPSIPWGNSGIMKPPKPVTSIGQCCNIMESEDVQKRVLCLDGMRTLTFKSAKICSCYHCKKD